MLHGARSYLLQDEDGQTIESHSISAGLDYPGVGPEHAWLVGHRPRRATAPSPTPRPWTRCACSSRTEGIIPAIESAHALAGALELGRELGPDAVDPREPLGSRRQGHGRPPRATSSLLDERRVQS